ncbi:MAG TPA: dihydrofolate reductase family protein [Trebonia sp.]|jgi:dihydrofolate reductase|nr:dihydrofolate reductase family protein [Trebonia sp.]
MRRLIVTVFNYSLDGLLADQDTDFWKFCFSRPQNSRPDDPAHLAFLAGADAHLMGRATYEAMSQVMTTAGHPFAGLLTAGRKVVFSRTLRAADWANTTIAAGETAAEVGRLRQGGDGYLIAWGGVALFRSLLRLDLVDELHVTQFPYIAGEGTRLFDGVPRSYQLDLVSSVPDDSGCLELRYRRPR